MCSIYLPLQPWAVPLEMLTRNKVHSFLSGHRMFPPQPREHFFGYLLGEAWHFHRDCNTVKPKEDGGEDVGLQQEPAESLFPAGRGIPRARSMGSCHTQPHSSSTNRNQSWTSTPTPSWAYSSEGALDPSASFMWIIPTQSWDVSAEMGMIFLPWLSPEHPQRAAKTEASGENSV